MPNKGWQNRQIKCRIRPGDNFKVRPDDEHEPSSIIQGRENVGPGRFGGGWSLVGVNPTRNHKQNLVTGEMQEIVPRGDKNVVQGTPPDELIPEPQQPLSLSVGIMFINAGKMECDTDDGLCITNENGDRVLWVAYAAPCQCHRLVAPCCASPCS